MQCSVHVSAYRNFVNFIYWTGDNDNSERKKQNPERKKQVNKRGSSASVVAELLSSAKVHNSYSYSMCIMYVLYFFTFNIRVTGDG